jgi:sterol desaturase/sphingolipid hydroxylase (fatty acid hydroxylase superfamily)
MVVAVLVTIVSLVLSNFLGYWIHRALHQKWAGPFHRAHMQHHLELYPPGKLTSVKYRNAHWYNRGPFLFTPPFLVIVAVALGIARLLHAPMWTVAEIATIFVAFGFLNDWVHDTFHLRRHPLQKLRYYRRARIAHFVHHVDMSKNYGIVAFEWDRAFGTMASDRAK